MSLTMEESSKYSILPIFGESFTPCTVTSSTNSPLCMKHFVRNCSTLLYKIIHLQVKTGLFEINPEYCGHETLVPSILNGPCQLLSALNFTSHPAMPVVIYSFGIAMLCSFFMRVRPKLVRKQSLVCNIYER